jgi:hypothetical protein
MVFYVIELNKAMRRRENIIFLNAIIVILFSVFFSACVSRQIMYPEYLFSDSTRHIRITLNDGSILKFSPGRYSVLPSSDSVIVSGKGTRIPSGSKRTEERFEGTVHQSNIKELEIAEVYVPVPFWYPAGAIFGGMVVFMLVLII